MRILLFLCILISGIAWAKGTENAEDAFAKKDYKKALGEYRILLKENPTVPEWLYNAGVSALRTGDYSEARDLLLRYRKQKPDDAYVVGELPR